MPDFKKRRDAETEHIRRKNREEIFSKRRNILNSDNRQSPIEIEPAKKDRLLVVDERYRPQIETYPSPDPASSECPTRWTASPT